MVMNGVGAYVEYKQLYLKALFVVSYANDRKVRPVCYFIIVLIFKWALLQYCPGRYSTDVHNCPFILILITFLYLFTGEV